MDSRIVAPFRHSHDFGPDRTAAERRTRIVIALNAVMMVIEIGAGWRFHSMALTADGWHMSTHVAAFLITAFAYAMSRRCRTDSRYSFGTGKIEILGGYTSAIVLGLVAAAMAAQSAVRLFAPASIRFSESIWIALVGLAVNVTSALLLKHDHGHGHGHPHGHDHSHHQPEGDDLNLKAAYLHVVADAVTSVLAVGALTAGRFLGWVWLDPVMGLVGAAVVGQWAWSLLGTTGTILLDRTPETDLVKEIAQAVESDGESAISDLHVWQIGAGQFSAIVSIVSRRPRSPEHYRELFREHAELRHVTVEVNPL